MATQKKSAKIRVSGTKTPPSWTKSSKLIQSGGNVSCRCIVYGKLMNLFNMLKSKAYIWSLIRTMLSFQQYDFRPTTGTNSRTYAVNRSAKRWRYILSLVFLVHVGKVCTYPSLTAKTLLRFVFLKKIFLLGLFVPCLQMQRCCYCFFPQIGFLQ